MTLKEFFTFKNNKFFWLNIIGMVLFVVLMVFGALKALDIYTHHGEAVAVPDVKGMGLNEAQMMIRNHELTSVVADSTYVENRPAGTVLEVNPAAGQLVKKGRVIYLTVNSLSVPLVAVPDIVENSSLREAEVRITASGFKLDSVQHVAGEKDWVYGVKYRGRTLMIGERVPMGASLVIVAGDGGEEQKKDTLKVDTPASAGTTNNGNSGDDDWF